MGNVYIAESAFTASDGSRVNIGDQVDDAVISITAARAAGAQLTPTNTALAARALLARTAREEATARGGLSVEPSLAQNVKASYRRSGQVTMTGAVSTAVVTLTPAEADTGYRLQAFIVEHTDAASPVAGSTNVWGSLKAVGGFRLNLDAAPGGTDVVTVDWVLTRD